MKAKETSNNVIPYLIGGFLEFGHAQDYHFIPAEAFGEFAPLFDYLKKNGNAKRPEFYDACQKVGIQKVTKAMERADVTFITDRSKYVEQAYNSYVSSHMVGRIPPMEIFEATRETYKRIFESGLTVSGDVLTASDLCVGLENEILEAMENPEKKTGYATGIKVFDELTGGIIKGRSMRISAYSNTGKSSLSYYVCNNVLRQGAKVLYLTLEVTKEEVRNRLIANWYGINSWKFDKKHEIGTIDLSEFAGLPLHVASLSATTMDVENLVKAIRPDVLFIDYVQLIRAKGEGEYEKMTAVARELQRIIIENDVALFDLSQVSNDNMAYQRGGKIPSKGSGELVASASQVIVMQPSETEGYIELHLAKNRHGKKDVSIEIKPNFSICDFSDVISEFIPKNKSKGKA